MNKNILYIWGAGASAQALPIVSEVYERIDVINELIQNKIIRLNSEKEFNTYFEAFRATLINFNSFDTYAKLLFLNNRETKYQHFKSFLKMYFSIEQSISDFELVAEIKKNKENVLPKSHEYFISEDDIIKITKYKKKIDPRYESFLVNIWDGVTSKIKIFSWNYDTQLKLAIDSLNLFSDPKNIDIQESEIKINGSIDSPKLSFGWELNKNYGNLYKQFLQDVGEIVIIGYSFPFANREIDESYLRIFSDRHKTSTNPVIFRIQTLESDFERCKERLISLLENSTKLPTLEWDIRPIFDSTEFYIPAHY